MIIFARPHLPPPPPHLLPDVAAPVPQSPPCLPFLGRQIPAEDPEAKARGRTAGAFPGAA